MANVEKQNGDCKNAQARNLLKRGVKGNVSKAECRCMMEDQKEQKEMVGMQAPPSGDLKPAIHTYSRNDGLAANTGSI